MVAVKEKFSYLPDGSVDLDAWLKKMATQHTLSNTDLLNKTIQVASHVNKGLTTFYGQPCIEQSLEMAEIILDLKVDQEAVAAAILLSATQHANLSIDTITTELNSTIAILVNGVLQMNVINNIANIQSRDPTQIDRLRKILLSMVSDIRMVLIKLAERTCIMRGIKNINPIERKRIAQETLDLYAPLANRLGIGQLKWELEDIAFHYTDPDAYKAIATFLAERRADREQRIKETIVRLTAELKKANIRCELSGRAKHIYSIFSKTQKKHLDYKNVFDFSAVRILVPTIEDCYSALSIVHSIWNHIPEEFDDYISNPKPNGYRSIHTAVVGPEGKNMEIQIRTFDIHEEAEHGVAAHWLYKESKPHASGYESKITFLRQLVAWHKDIAKNEDTLDTINQGILEDRVYAFTPAGKILDLEVGSTPLDFAYQVHTELGHQCRGAKINGHIVPLTYSLQTGDQVEIITSKNGTPSRDWINKSFGYLKTSRARAKVAQWFRQQESTQYIESGKNSLEREIARTGIPHPNLQKIATHFHYKDDDALFAALGHGIIRLAQVMHVIQHDHHEAHTITPVLHHKKTTAPSTEVNIAQAHDLLTRIARCCKPIPGDPIIGFITQGRGVSIHRKNCPNLPNLPTDKQNRLMEVSWHNKQLSNYYVDLQIQASGTRELLKEIAALLSNLKVDLIALNSTMSKKNNIAYITITIQIHDLAQLQQIINNMRQLPHIIDVKRLRA